jgi:Domain of unknown function (DUF4091)
MRFHSLLAILALALVGNSPAAVVPWHHPLALGNDGYWPQRVAVTLTNDSGQSLAGERHGIVVPALAGARAESVRVCRGDGVELLFDLRDHGGVKKRTGAMRADDTLVIPVECAAKGSATVFVYWGNDAAWAVPDFLPGDPVSGDALSTLHMSVGELEQLRLSPALAPKPAAGGAGQNWVEVRVRNLGEERIGQALVRANLTPALVRLPGGPAGMGSPVASADGVELPSYEFRRGGDFLFRAELAPRSEQLFQIRFRDSAPSDSRTALDGYQRLLDSAANLAPNGSFEKGADAPDSWRKPADTGSRQVKAGFNSDARFGQRSLELAIADNPKAEWLGWNSMEIPVRPGGTYLLSGWLKAVGLQSSAAIHAHFHNAQGALTSSGAMVSTQPTVSDSSDWVNSMAYIQAPPDAASIQVHLTMNTQGTLRHDGLVLCEVVDACAVRAHTAGEQAPTAGLRVWEVNPLVKVFPDSPPQRQARTVAVELAGNESESFQLAVRGDFQGTNHVEVSVSQPRSSADATLPPVRIERVGFVPIDYPSSYYSTDVPDWCRKMPRGTGSTDGWAGWWPDPLAPGERFDLAPGQTQPLWFTVRAPKQAPPGEYRAELTLRGRGMEPVSVPVTIRVLPFTLPERTKLRAIFDMRFGPGGAFGSGVNSPEGQRRWLRFMAEHRLGTDGIQPPPKFSYKEGKVTMDATEFDQTARFCFDELGMNVSYTPQFFYMFGWAYPPKKLFGLEPFTPEWTAAFKQAYQLFVDHLREKGWHDKFVYYISDEPHFQHEFVVEQMKKLCAMIHEVDPTIPIYSSTWRHCPGWDDALDLWGIGQYGCFPVAEMERLEKAGKHMWFTCDGQMATDTPYLATERMLPYYCFKYGVEGFEFWGFAWWTYDPWQVGWHKFIRQSDEGKKYYWVRYPDGDGFLAYPGKSVGIDGPVSTIRLEQVREGLEDYEALTLLVQRMETAKQAGKSIAAAERALQMAKDLVTIPNAGGLRSTEILPDPDRLPAIRKAVNAALSELVGQR